MKNLFGTADKKHMLNRVALVIGGNLLFAVGINMIITPMNLYSSGLAAVLRECPCCCECFFWMWCICLRYPG